MEYKQVNKEHYAFAQYVDKRRWASMWCQIAEVLDHNPAKVLEIGPGPGVFKAVMSQFGVSVETLDLDPDLSPDHVASADNLPFENDEYDVVCAFQMLEHVPYEKAVEIFGEMSRVGGRGVVISLPDARKGMPCSFHIPKRGDWKFIVPRPRFGPKEHVFDGQHFWELNKKGFPVEKVVSDFVQAGKVELARTYQVVEAPYHRFFVFDKLR